MMTPDTPVLSISELNQISKNLLEDAMGQIWVTGEISNLSMPRSGHCYFSLKDADAQIACALFRGSRNRLNFELEDGMHLIANAKVTLYEPSGRYQLIVNYAEPAGVGLLQKQFEALKAKLQAEGLFDDAHKQALPHYPQTIGIITSATGAAVHDIIRVITRRNPSIQLIVYPTSVQGDAAANEIAQAIQIANTRKECDALILARGGGSLEDLWPFNEEIVARAIFASTLPIISGVGHEVDTTIADFVADYRAATPSAAAEIISFDWQDLQATLRAYQQELTRNVSWSLQHKQQQLTQYQHRLKHPQQLLEEHAQRLDHSELRLLRSWENIFARWQQRVNQHATLLAAVNPLKVLERGYAIVSDQHGKVIASANTAKKAKSVKIRFSDETVSAVVDSTTK